MQYHELCDPCLSIRGGEREREVEDEQRGQEVACGGRAA
jgi:hypothetical protein